MNRNLLQKVEALKTMKILGEPKTKTSLFENIIKYIKKNFVN